GYVDSLARPGGNATGFTNFEYSMGAKWLELLKEIAPAVTRAAVGAGQFSAVQTAAPSLGIEARPVNVRDPSEGADRVSAPTRRRAVIAGGPGLATTHGVRARRDQLTNTTLAAWFGASLTRNRLERSPLPLLYAGFISANAKGGKR